MKKPKTKAVINSDKAQKDVIQSYILTSAKYNFSVYEKRILYRLVELAQSEVNGLDFKEKTSIKKVEHDLFGLVTVTLPVASILSGEEDKNHYQVKKALTALSQKYVIYEDDEIWEKLNIVVFPKIEKRANDFQVTLNPKIWDVILDFSKGFKKYELQTAMQFESIYSMRFYELLSGQTSPITLSIEKIKEMFQIAGKYKRVNGFFERVIEPAKRELDANSPFSFIYEKIKTGRKITAVKIYPVVVPENRNKKLEKRDLKKQVSLRWDLDKVILDYLKREFEFTDKEIKNNLDLFKRAQANTKVDLILFLSGMRTKAREKNNPKGYLINALKKHIEQAH